ncbi:tRNA 2-selenouridine synthase [Cognatiyoonia koreensis]|uniref:tRNA 2-selenouridine synthase n=1 Tax=Cognatiyoonia koreensis TaxID=364200 RepID=A0A1I0RVF9_9RHOB|nr:tRNA 2-selenouridine(34) synthase MnmH [Cognatiyoonia koreensis]SEW45478.1 tRNA 2-selenouridine synthase [Cognatiyoonia koreensis]
MALTFSAFSDILNHGFDTVIDVRSPTEFAEDHIPGAINLPSLSNDERAEVGTIYKQISPFKARKIGASLVLNNVARHIAGPLKDYDGGWQPLVYCWRGGQRSGVFSMLLKEVGWRAQTVAGGYQTFRRIVKNSLYDAPLPHRFILLDGYTGTAKTALLPRLAERGVQTLDLEGLARHRGSLLGALPGGQPSQRAFETSLAVALHDLDPNRVTIVEAESSKIGRLNLPPSLWSVMLGASRIDLTASPEVRAVYLATAYDDILRDPLTVRDRLAGLRHMRGHAVVDRWQALQDAGDYTGLAAALMADHYDPAYAKSRRIDARSVISAVHADTLDEDGLNRVADLIAAQITAL